MIAITNCSQLVTMAGPARPRLGAEMRELAIVPDGALLIDGDLIVSADSRTGIASRMPAGTQVIDARQGVVTPGFVDAHTHPVFAGNRAGEFELRASGATYQDVAAAGGGIRSTVRLTRAASDDDLFAAANRYAGWFLRNGTTTIEAKSGYGLTLEAELKLLRVMQRVNAERSLHLVPTFLGAHEIPDEFRGNTEGYVDLVVREMLPRVAAEGTAKFCDVFCEDHVFTVAQSRRILSAAREHGLGLRMHVDQLTRSGGAQLAAELQADSADHLEYAIAEDIEALRRSGVQPVLLPGSAYALGSRRYPGAREMIDAGLAVVLATDFNPGSSPTPSMPMILSLASTHLKMSPAEALTATTVNAAYSLRLGDRIGSLEPGKRADVVIHDCGDYRELAYFFGVEHPRIVIAKGRIVFER